jgi:hypothetical protein
MAIIIIIIIRSPIYLRKTASLDGEAWRFDFTCSVVS